MVCKKGVLRNFATFHAFLKKSLWHRCFPVNFMKFLRTTFLQNTSGRLLLLIELYYFKSFTETSWRNFVETKISTKTLFYLFYCFTKDSIKSYSASLKINTKSSYKHFRLYIYFCYATRDDWFKGIWNLIRSTQAFDQPDFS